MDIDPSIYAFDTIFGIDICSNSISGFKTQQKVLIDTLLILIYILFKP